MFYPLGKNSEKPYGGVAPTPFKTEDPERNCIQGTTRQASWVIVQFAKYQRIYDIPRCPGAEKM